jgi:hypothetical protein
MDPIQRSRTACLRSKKRNDKFSSTQCPSQCSSASMVASEAVAVLEFARPQFCRNCRFKKLISLYMLLYNYNTSYQKKWLTKQLRVEDYLDIESTTTQTSFIEITIEAGIL